MRRNPREGDAPVDRAERSSVAREVAIALDGSEMAGLVEELAARGVPVRFQAKGGSMSPWIRDGDVVTVAPIGGEAVGGNENGQSPRAPRLGDVAAFRRQPSGRLTVHRLVRREAEGWIARGDRLAGEDGSVRREELLGLVTRVERAGREIWVPRGLAGLLLARLSRFALGARARWLRR